MNVKQRSLLKQFSFWLFIYTLLVILWGAWVRISHSGDGCGKSWPTCQGELIPDLSTSKTWIEYAHRLMSGIYGVLVLGYTLTFVKICGQGNPLTKISYVTLGLTITEAILGAKLVLSGLVGADHSTERIFVVALHQINSLFLSGSIVWTYFLLKDSTSENTENPFLKIFSKKSLLLLLPFLFIATSGSWAALSGSLFPSLSLSHGLQQDLQENAHKVVRLRVLHPLLALLIGGSFIYYFANKASKLKDEALKSYFQNTALYFFIALVFGIMTLALLSPTWMKLSHLLIVHLLWAQLLKPGLRLKT
ncbi:MAG TPA: COX15/CtaA family protein [Pseudobdellovibrionaceae bacterium]|nr:COX15/CtaA family protein [Pseudobdellovibrionaceae bacterium]